MEITNTASLAIIAALLIVLIGSAIIQIRHKHRWWQLPWIAVAGLLLFLAGQWFPESLKPITAVRGPVLSPEAITIAGIALWMTTAAGDRILRDKADESTQP